MKKVFWVLAILLLSPAFGSAHPGHLGDDGCHVCLVHCEKWGVKRGERHCHHKIKPIKSTPVSPIQKQKKVTTSGKTKALPSKVKVHGWDYIKKEPVPGNSTPSRD